MQQAVENWDKEMEETECAAEMLQSENTMVSNKEDIIMSNGLLITFPNDKSYFPEVVLDWDYHKSLVKCSDIVSKVLAIAGQNSELTTSMFISPIRVR